MSELLGHSMSKMVGLVGCSWYTVVSSCLKWPEKGQLVNWQQLQEHPGLIGGEGSLAHLV